MEEIRWKGIDELMDLGWLKKQQQQHRSYLWDSSISKPSLNKRLQSSLSQGDHRQPSFKGLGLCGSDAFSLRVVFSKSFHWNTKATKRKENPLCGLSFLPHSVLFSLGMIQAVGFLMTGSVRSDGEANELVLNKKHKASYNESNHENSLFWDNNYH